MSKTLIKNLKPRTKIYAAILLICAIAVLIRIAVVQIERSRPIVSFVSEWAKYGTPVTIKEIKAADIPVNTKFTVTGNSDRLASGFVTADIKDKLKEGQEVYLTENGSLPYGKISRIGQELDISTGMFPVEVEFNVPVAALGSISVVFVRTSTLQKVLVVPNEILDMSGDDYYLWKIENGKARKIKVKIGSRDNYGAVIAEGIQDGDWVIFSGQSRLKDGEKVNIIQPENIVAADSEGKTQ
jgi:membrane fusion protein (multidrug efflux system)